MKLIKILASLAMVTFLNYSFADGHAVNLKSKKIGLLQLNWSPEALFMTSANSGSNKLSGTITINNTKGNIDACYEKFMIKSTGPILNNVTCQVKFDNGTTMQMDYSMVLSPFETFWDKLSKGETMTAPNNGIMYWHATMKMQTVSETYGWVNKNVFLMKGKKLQGPIDGKTGNVTYDIYKFIY